MYLTAKALQQLRRLIELTSVCCMRIPKMFAVSRLYSGVEEASPSLSVKIEGAYIPINHLEVAWEESDCIMWDLAANQYPEHLTGANWVLEVLLVDLRIISLGIIGNFVCHEALITQIISTRGLMETIIDQVFLATTTCLGQPCRFLTLGLQGSERAAWTSALRSEHILNRTLWIAEHALNPQLVGESVGLLLAKEENQHEVASILLPILNNPGLLGLLVNLLSFETGNWARERIPETAAGDSLREVASVGINLSSVAPRNDKDRIGMKWGIGSRKNKHLVVEAAGRSKEHVAVALTSLSRAVVVLNKSEDLPPMAYGLFIAPQCVEVISSKACGEAAFPSQTSLREIIAAMTSRCAKTLTITSAIITYAEKSLRTHTENRVKPSDRVLLESTVALLSSEKSALPISFLCSLLQCALRLKASSSCKNELGKRISAILEHVTANDLLVLSFTYDEEGLFDLESVRRILSGLLAKERNVDVFNGDNFKEGYSAAMQQVAKTGDAYLGEIASYSDLSTSKEDIVYALRLRSCGVPLIRKAIMHKRFALSAAAKGLRTLCSRRAEDWLQQGAEDFVEIWPENLYRKWSVKELTSHGAKKTSALDYIQRQGGLWHGPPRSAIDELRLTELPYQLILNFLPHQKPPLPLPIRIPFPKFDSAETEQSVYKEGMSTDSKKPSSNCHEVSLTPEEQQRKINEVRRIVGPLPENLPIYCSDASISRHLRARNWHVKKATKALKETLKWRSEYKPEEIRWEDIAREAETGKIYRSNFVDKQGRTVLVMRPCCQNTNSTKGQIKYFVYCMENAILNLPPNQEQMVWLIDFHNFNLGNISVMVTKETAHVLQGHYPERLGIAILYNPPKFFEQFWTAVKPFLEPKTRKKVKFVYPNDANSKKILGELFDLDQLESAFGGNNTEGFDIHRYAERMKEDDRRMHSLWTRANDAAAAANPSLLTPLNCIIDDSNSKSDVDASDEDKEENSSTGEGSHNFSPTPASSTNHNFSLDDQCVN
ncbi:hypothetical protein Nepgr_001963 [Nepenthes gracilis]|uniref:CRAL-TRIO domain-containing protein n=1 Tax=Nepenthes gracilis TaxID=150966 RepID=A0AAD3RXG8_NEPGR|nr:hypothetical protein Nepgr_001963 [Nepenthes gracilis]